MSATRTSAASLVSPAEVARLAKVTRAAVSNWRKRYADFPAPVRGAGRTALFDLAEIRSWLDRHRKGDDPSPEVVLWHALRARYGSDMVRGLADVSMLLTAGSAQRLDSDLGSLIRELIEERTSAEVLTALVERMSGGEYTSTPRLVRAIGHFVGPVTGTVFDPACGVGSLLLAFATSDTSLAGQECHEAAARLAGARLKLVDPGAAVRAGDSLRQDRWSQLRAELVVCDPPVNVADWGREDLLLDTRWEFGVPTRAESELAWLQHCYSHVAHGGRAVVVMPPSVAYRKAGRRIRAELVRRGVLSGVVALPPGMAALHAQPVQLWLLERPVDAESSRDVVRMVDLSANDPDETFEPVASQIADVPLIDLLDEDVDLTPARYVAAQHVDHLAEYATACAAVVARLHELSELLPELGKGQGALDGPSVKMADLVRAGLVSLTDDGAASKSDRLDTDFVRGFLSSAANAKRATSSSGSFRADVTGARIPQLGVDEQRRYGAAFRSFEEFDRLLAELAKLGQRATSLGRDGLTLGALRPEPRN
ncbi:N-6 DNA methylase [Amycolatopsis australiensis]|uniref:N-6 DNA Methylase n=1 Tax=Amycolatopsis australiensis TaxID=546364 RepID=A0A1K1QUH4_9PSEU|nr:N-6 DNA methylase [Amycolatopsis australiensis]SFW63520.1 N-6 DNA Methylase [Amycolatopsis australiensis]